MLYRKKQSLLYPALHNKSGKKTKTDEKLLKMKLTHCLSINFKLSMLYTSIICLVSTSLLAFWQICIMESYATITSSDAWLNLVIMGQDLKTVFYKECFFHMICGLECSMDMGDVWQQTEIDESDAMLAACVWCLCVLMWLCVASSSQLLAWWPFGSSVTCEGLSCD